MAESSTMSRKLKRGREVGRERAMKVSFHFSREEDLPSEEGRAEELDEPGRVVHASSTEQNPRSRA